MGTPSLSDDFHARVIKRMQPMFRDRVLPLHLMPYLTCLSPVDEEVIAAQHKQVGDTLAADQLFRQLVRKQGWFKDLMRALRHHEVKLNDLADEFEAFITTIPVRWDIAGFKDNFGRACFTGECETITSETEEDLSPINQLIQECSISDQPMNEGAYPKRPRQSTNPKSLEQDLTEPKYLVQEGTKPKYPAHDETTPKFLAQDLTEQKDPTRKDPTRKEQSLPDLSAPNKQMHLLHAKANISKHLSECNSAPFKLPLQNITEAKHHSEDMISPKCFEHEHLVCVPAEQSLFYTCSESTEDGCMSLSTCADAVNATRHENVQDFNRSTEHETYCASSTEKSHNQRASKEESKFGKNGKNGVFQRREEEIRQKREELRLKFIEKLYEFIKSPEDVPVAVMYMEKINLNIQGIEKGSILFNVKVNSLEDLGYLKELLRYGGLKRMLDKELLGADQMKDFGHMSTDIGHSVCDIESQVTINLADIARCKVWLQDNIKDILIPVQIIEGLCRENEAGDRIRRSSIAAFVFDHIPDSLHSLLEDPFIVSRIHDFYDSPRIQEKFKGQDTLHSPEHVESQPVVSHLLFWIRRELTEYFENIESEMIEMLFQFAHLTFLYIKHFGKSAVLPDHDMIKHALGEGYLNIRADDECHNEDVESVYECIPYEEVVDSIIMKDLLFGIRIPDVIPLNTEHIDGLLSILYQKNIIVKTMRGYSFRSTFLRDVLLASIIPVQHIITPEFNLEEYPYILHALGFCELTFENVRVHHENIFFKIINQSAFAIVNAVIGNGFIRTHVSTGSNDSPFYIKDLRDMNDVADIDEEIVLEINHILNGQILVIGGSHGDLHIDASVANYTAMHERHFLAFLWALNIVDAVPLDRLKNVEEVMSINTSRSQIENNRMSSISLKGQVVSPAILGHLSEYLKATPTIRKLSLESCKLQVPVLKKHIVSSNFKHISCLNISNNPEIGASIANAFTSLGFHFLPHLEILDVSNCSMGDNGVVLMSLDFRHLKRLRKINLANNGISMDGLFNVYMSLSRNITLTCVVLKDNPISNAGWQILATWLGQLIVLEELDLSNCGITGPTMASVVSCIASNELRVLRLSDNKITNADDMFDKLSQKRLLIEFDFSGNAVYEKDDGYVSDQSAMKSKKDPFIGFIQAPWSWSKLFLSSCGLGKNRIFHGRKLSQNVSELTHICLADNGIDDVFASDLSVFFIQACKFVEYIDLSDNRIGNAGSVALALSFNVSERLKTLLLQGNCFSKDGRIVLQSICEFHCSLKKYILQ